LEAFGMKLMTSYAIEQFPLSPDGEVLSLEIFMAKLPMPLEFPMHVTSETIPAQLSAPLNYKKVFTLLQIPHMNLCNEQLFL